MRYVWILTLIAAAAGVTGIGCAVWVYLMPLRGDGGYTQVGWAIAAVIFIGLAALAGLAAGGLYLITQLPH